VVNGVILRPLPVPRPNQLVVLALQQSGSADLQKFSYPAFVDLRDQGTAIGEMAAFRLTLGGLSADNRGDHCLITRVSGNYFQMLGIQPALGRLILPSEGQTPEAGPVIVLGYSYWQKRFGGDPSVVGKHVELNNHPLTVVGVAPKGFRGTYAMVDSDLYVPLSANVTIKEDNAVQETWTKRSERQMSLIGRLNPGQTVQSAQSGFNVIAQRIAADHPDSDKGISIRVFPENRARPEPDADDSLGMVSKAFLTLAALVLLVACFNVSNVLLVRATGRQKEMAIRAALGAGRLRLIRQYLTESLALAFLGGGVGMLLTFWATQYLSSISFGTDLPVKLDFLPDLRVYLYVGAAVLLTGVIVGVFPALRVARRDIRSTLNESSRGSSSSRKRHIARGTLVVAQVAGSLVLLIIAGLFVRSLTKAQSVYLGFDPTRTINFSLDVQQINYGETQGRAFYRELETRLAALPGVDSAAQAFSIPLGLMSASSKIYLEGHPLENGKQPPESIYNAVSPAYFRTLHIPLHRGRTFADADNEKAPEVAVINEAMAAKFWPGQDPVGKHFSSKGDSGPWVSVIGVVSDGKYKGLVEDPQPFYYLPVEQQYFPFRTFHVRTALRPEDLAVNIQAQVRELAPNLPISEFKTMEQALDGPNGFLFFRLGAQLTSVMGLLGLVLAVVGVYSVASYAAAQRTHEIGIRIAVGARPADILRMVLRQAFGVVAIGIATGLALAFVSTRLVADLFYGVKPSDPLTFAAVSALLIGVALIACWVPAHRATGVSPLIALRSE
jgi:macrolide transport system ATP-binding/permease protein